MPAPAILAALARLAMAGSRAAPAMEGSAAALRAARMARAARGTDSMKGANQRFDLVGKPKFGDVVPAGPVTTPPGSAVAVRGSTMPAAPPAGGLPAGIASPPPAGGGALATRGSGAASPDIYGKIGGAMLTGAAGANVASESPTSIFDYLPQRAEGDPAGAMNRRNDPMEPGYSGDAGRLISGAGLANQPEPGYGAPQVGDKESYGMSDAAYRFRDLPGYDDESRPQARRPAPAANIPLPPPRPSDGPSGGQSSAELMQQYNDSMKDDGGGQASLLALAERAQREGRASGGSAGKMSSGGGGKDAAIHKALEIIHHLLTRR